MTMAFRGHPRRMTLPPVMRPVVPGQDHGRLWRGAQLHLRAVKEYADAGQHARDHVGSGHALALEADDILNSFALQLGKLIETSTLYIPRWSGMPSWLNRVVSNCPFRTVTLSWPT